MDRKIKYDVPAAKLLETKICTQILATCSESPILEPVTRRLTTFIKLNQRKNYVSSQLNSTVHFGNVLPV